MLLCGNQGDDNSGTPTQLPVEPPILMMSFHVFYGDLISSLRWRQIQGLFFSSLLAHLERF